MRAFEVIRNPKDSVEKQFVKKLRIELSIADSDLTGSDCDDEKQVLVGSQEQESFKHDIS